MEYVKVKFGGHRASGGKGELQARVENIFRRRKHQKVREKKKER